MERREECLKSHSSRRPQNFPATPLREENMKEQHQSQVSDGASGRGRTLLVTENPCAHTVQGLQLLDQQVGHCLVSSLTSLLLHRPWYTTQSIRSLAGCMTQLPFLGWLPQTPGSKHYLQPHLKWHKEKKLQWLCH